MIQKTFDQKGTFAALSACESWCRDNGISTASLSSPLPTGLMWGDVYIAKWKNLTSNEIKRLHGRFEAGEGGYREGPIHLQIMEKGDGVFPHV